VQGGQYRPLVGMRVEVEGLGPVEVFSVHLDHRQYRSPASSHTHALLTTLTVMMTNKRESRRVAQVESLVAYLDASCGPLRALLGDFNALSRWVSCTP
jgi:endonuclease/exonuclease/phosphatase family metal-dependent hydrolase